MDEPAVGMLIRNQAAFVQTDDVNGIARGGNTEDLDRRFGAGRGINQRRD